MMNKIKHFPAQDIDFPLENGVHIAGVTCSSHVSPTTSFQSLSKDQTPKGAVILGSDVPSRFWARVDAGRPADCWLWKGPVDRYGYGRAVLGGKFMAASRVAYILATGSEPKGLLVCHHCDNPRCCNPSHLYAGTSSDNQKDKFKRGLTHRGSKNPAARLTDEQVLRVKTLIAEGRPNTVIAAEFGVHHSTISKIRTGNSW